MPGALRQQSPCCDFAQSLAFTPQLVVVETALNTAHGSAHGNEISRQDCLTFAHAAAPGSHEQVRCDFWGENCPVMGHAAPAHEVCS